MSPPSIRIRRWSRRSRTTPPASTPTPSASRRSSGSRGIRSTATPARPIGRPGSPAKGGPRLPPPPPRRARGGPHTNQPPPAGGEPAGPIPEWMQAAGWTPGSSESAEGPVSFSDDELRSLEAGMLPPDAAPEPEGGLARADIPDWLKDVAPPGADADAAELAQASAAPAAPEGISGLDEPRLPPGWTAPPPAASADEDDWLKDAAEESPAVPTWMEEQAPGATATIVTWLGDRTRQETPLPERSTPQPYAVRAAAPEEVSPEPAALPEWLSDQVPSAEGEGGAPAREAASGPPASLSGLAEAAP